MKLTLFVYFTTILLFVSARSQQNNLDSTSSEAQQIVQRAFNKKCSDSYSVACFKLDVVSLFDRLSTERSFQIFPSVSMVRNEEVQSNEGRSASSSESTESVLASMAQDGLDSSDNRLDKLIVDRVSRYLDTHAIRVRLFDDETLDKLNKVGQEAAEKYGYLAAQSGRGKDKKGGGGLLAALMMMKATLGALGFGAVAALAGKALMVGLLSMMLSAIVGLKSLASGGGGKAVTYEIISKPVYSHSHSHSHEAHDHGGGYGGSYGHGRSADLAYQAHANAN